MLQLIAAGMHFCPVILCDHCGELIKVAEGNVEWQYDKDGLPRDGKFYFLHKKCFVEFWEDEQQPPYPMSVELQHFLANLVHNVGFVGEVAKKAERSAQLLGRL